MYAVVRCAMQAQLLHCVGHRHMQASLPSCAAVVARLSSEPGGIEHAAQGNLIHARTSLRPRPQQHKATAYATNWQGYYTISSNNAASEGCCVDVRERCALPMERNLPGPGDRAHTCGHFNRLELPELHGICKHVLPTATHQLFLHCAAPFSSSCSISTRPW
jgi:hypothetical protein